MQSLSLLTDAWRETSDLIPTPFLIMVGFWFVVLITLVTIGAVLSFRASPRFGILAVIAIFSGIGALSLAFIALMRIFGHVDVAKILARRFDEFVASR